NGTIAATVIGGTAPYQYSIDGNNFQLSPYFSGLPAGIYLLTVRDATGCSTSINSTIIANGAPIVTLSATISSCATNTGTITAAVTGGVAPYTYSLTGQVFQVSNTFTALAPGNYVVWVRDASGCMAAMAATVSAIAGPTLTVNITPAGCADNEGIIVANATGGTAPLQYRLNTGAYQSSNTFSALSTGQYQVTVRDANGCLVMSVVNVTNTTGLQISAGSVSASCSANNGAITLSGLGGVLPYTYNLNNGAFQSSSIFTGLSAGNYIAKIKDANGCIRISNLTVGLIGVPTIATTQVNTNCNGTNGSITISGTGGLSPYTFSIDGTTYQTTGAFTHLAAGSYTAYLKDSTGCMTTKPVVLTNIGAGPAPDFISVIVDPSNCGADDGKIDTDADGGDNPLRYSIDGINFQSGSAFNHLFAGSYTITVRDNSGCTNTVSVVVPNHNGSTISGVTTTSTCAVPTGTITVTASVSPGPFLYSINGVAYQTSNVFTALPAGVYTVWVDDGTDCITTKQFVILNSDGPSVTATVTNAYCSANNGTITLNGSGTPTLAYSIDGVSFQVSNSFPNLFAGNYTVTVRDGNGCKNSRLVTVGNVAAPTASFVINAANCNSNNGLVRVVASGGLRPFQYSLNGISFQTDSVFQNLAPGNYTITILDANSCFSRTDFIVGTVAMPVVTGAAAPTTCGVSAGQIFAVASGGVAPYQYSINGIVYQSGTIFTGLSSGGYTLYVKDANGCINQTGVNVLALNAPQITATATASGCNNNQGTIAISVTGTGAPFEYSINGSVYQPNNQFLNLAAGIYPITVKTSTGCISSSMAAVTALSLPTITANVSVASCTEGAGVITAFGNGGSGLLEYSIDGVNFQSATTFSGLINGDYQVEVRDAAGCSNATIATVYNFPAIQLSVDVQRVCGSNAVVLATANGGSGNLFYSLNGTQFFDNGVFNNVVDGNYTVLVQDEMGCMGSVDVSIAPAPSNPKTWLGFNNNWNDPVNWCGGVPDLLTHVIIPGGLNKYPILQMPVAYCNNITIETGASIQMVDGYLKIAGTISNQGILNAKGGTIELAGNAIQQIAGTTFFENTIRTLLIGNTSTGGVVVVPNLNDTLKISRKLAFSYATAKLTTANQIVLLSNDTATAALGIIEENVDGTPKATISGQIIVERYFPLKRAWRFLTAPIKNDAAAPSINAAWQEGANPPSVTGVANPNPHPTYGTHITGPANAPAAYSSAVTIAGFDQSPQNNSSMKYYNGLLNAYVPVNNTYSNTVTAKQAFLIFVRGNRSYDISSTTNFTVPSATILRVRGNVNTGKVSMPADTGFQVIGNPYPSAIRFDETMFNNNSSIMRTQSYWLWDPLRGSAHASPSNVGGWVPIVHVGGGVFFSTYNPGLSEVNIDSAHSFNIDGSVQSGSAFLIDNKAVVSGAFEVHESCKIDNSNNYSFRGANIPLRYMMLNLFRTDANQQAVYWADGTTILLNDTYDNAANEQEDVRKLLGSVENLGIRIANHSLAVDKRFGFKAGDTVQVETIRLKVGTYQFEVFFNDAQCDDLDIYFIDQFTSEKTQLFVQTHNMIHFTLLNEPGSYAADRFIIVFKARNTLPVQWISFQAQPNSMGVLLNWEFGMQLNVHHYEVERSQDGVHFATLSTVDVHRSLLYQWQDIRPLAGSSFYRIKVVDLNGTIHYSMVKNVFLGNTIGSIRVLNQLLLSEPIQLEFTQIKLGMYNCLLYNETGQLIQQDKIQHQQVNANYTLPLQKKLPAGTYHLSIETKGKIIGHYALIVGQ
ncbi:MAG: beta strand repeat-containing protein, partial [Ferruginibacter sp.]